MKVLGGLTVIVLLLWMIGLGIPRYRPLEQPVDTGLPTTSAKWDVTASSGALSFGSGVTLRAGETDRNLAYFRLPFTRPSAGRVLVRVSGRGTETRPETPSTGTAALGIRFDAAAGDGLYRNVRFAPGRHRDAQFSKVLEWPAALPIARIRLVSRPGAPALTIAEGRVELVRSNPRYLLALAVLIALALVWVIGCWRILDSPKVASRRRALVSIAPPIGILLIIVAGVTASATVLGPLARPLVVAAGSVLPLDTATVMKVLFKGGHALAFFLLTLCLLRARAELDTNRISVTLFMLLLAAGSEGVQTHLPDRGASLRDVMIDIAGIAFALLATHFVSRLADWRQR